MSNSPLSKKIAIVVVILLIIVALVFVMKKPATNTGSNMTANVAATTSETSATTTPAAPVIPVDPAVEQVKTSGVSDTSLAQDAKAIDEQMSGFSTDSKNAGVTTTTK